MNEEKENIIVKKSYDFALEIVKHYKILIEQKEFVLSKQLLRSGTSIGANIHEGIASESKKDFVHKLGIALKEARETSYWLNLLKNSSYLPLANFNTLIITCNEIVKILNSIILTTKQRYFSNEN
ncbi:MAG: four helix bundle protein [Chitinophagaceae bacterium]|nr:four helix bundle protein [Chitinophagaceae bacterium]